MDIRRVLLLRGVATHPSRTVSALWKRITYRWTARRDGVPLRLQKPGVLPADVIPVDIQPISAIAALTYREREMCGSLRGSGDWSTVLVPWSRGTGAFRTLPWTASLRTAAGVEPRAEWEVHRLQFLVPLARAHAAGHPTAAAAAVDVMSEWLEIAFDDTIPAWQSPMEVSLRAVSLAVAAGLLREEPCWREWWSQRGGALFDLHVRWVRSRIEDDSIRPSNHALVNLAAMAFTSAAMQRHAVARTWADRLERAAARQFLADGGHYERSTGYHLFVTEALLSAILALREIGVGSRRLEQVARSAVGFLVAVGEPLPLIGDHDSSHFLQPYFGGDPGNATWWKELAVRIFGELPRQKDCDARSAFGIGVSRRGGSRITLSAGISGQDGRGGHVHNDQLSLTVSTDSDFVLVDPGTSTYLADPATRALERSAAVHSTIRVGDAEVYPIDRASPFALLQSGAFDVRVASDGSITASHRPRSGHVLRSHERRVSWLSSSVIEVQDAVKCATPGATTVHATWHLPGVWNLAPDGDARIVELRCGDRAVTITADWASTVQRRDSFHAPMFGSQRPSTLVTLGIEMRGAITLRTVLKWSTESHGM